MLVGLWFVWYGYVGCDCVQIVEVICSFVEFICFCLVSVFCMFKLFIDYGSYMICNVLFFCIGNSVCSVLVEVILCVWGGDCFRVFSVGSQFIGQINFFVFVQLYVEGMFIESLCSKLWDEFVDVVLMDLVIIVCDVVVVEVCFVVFGDFICSYWGLFDLVVVEGIGVDKVVVFVLVYVIVKMCLCVLFVLFDLVWFECEVLQYVLDWIGQLLLIDSVQ